jgi:hypothetical protein
MDNSQIPPTDKQIEACMMILERIGECEADEHGQPIFERSMADADAFIKAHPYTKRHEPVGNPEDWGIPNH